MKRPLLTFATLASLTVAGCLTALAIGVSAASAWTLQDATTNGFHVDQYDGPNCPHTFITGHGSSYTDLGTTCDDGFQQALDGFMSTWCPCAQTTAASTTAESTPGATTTDPGSTTEPPPATSTVTVTVAASDPAVDQRLSALEGQYAALKSRVGNLEAASDAAWLAFRDALAAGMTDQQAADVARGTALNLIYGLGVFSP